MGFIESIKEAARKTKEKAEENRKEKLRLAAELNAEKERAEQEAKEANRIKVEAKRKKLGLPQGKIYYMTYKDKGDNYSFRDIEIIKNDYKNDTLYFYAFCHLKVAIRTFKAESVIYLSCEGQKIKDPWAYINSYEEPADIAAWAADNLAE